MPADRDRLTRILGAVGITVLFLIVVFYAFDQIPHSHRPVLVPSQLISTVPASP